MGRWAAIAIVGVLLSACSTFEPSIRPVTAREGIGVSVTRPAATAAPGPEATAALAWKAGQLCTNGHEPAQQTVESAENGQQLVDWKFRCSPYLLSPFGLPLRNDPGF